MLYFTEPIDEWCASQLSEFDGKKLVDVSKEGMDVDDDDKAKIEKAEMNTEFTRERLEMHKQLLEATQMNEDLVGERRFFFYQKEFLFNVSLPFGAS